MDKSALKPCPFCGGVAAFGYVRFTSEIYSFDGTQREDGHFVSCTSCGSSNQGVLCGYDDQDKAMEHWNRRTEQASDLTLINEGNIEQAIQPQWIPVSERQPEPGFYLCRIENPKSKHGFYLDTLCFGDYDYCDEDGDDPAADEDGMVYGHGWYDVNDDRHGDAYVEVLTSKVTHWMPLPAAPENAV